MESIRTHRGRTWLCGSCGQPCYFDESETVELGPTHMHFAEQWKGVMCPVFPMAADPVIVVWDASSLESLIEWYPDSREMQGRPCECRDLGAWVAEALAKVPWVPAGAWPYEILAIAEGQGVREAVRRLERSGREPDLQSRLERLELILLRAARSTPALLPAKDLIGEVADEWLRDWRAIRRRGACSKWMMPG